VRAEAERKAVNSTVQGSAADVIKAAMVAWSRWAEEAGGPPIRLVAQIHDELMFEVDVGRVGVWEAAQAVRGVMCGVAALRVPLRVAVKAGERWGQMAPVAGPPR
jgi:DNA polymerase I-like protein with 3'-5' exonuclease and polymerase domains